MAVEPNQKEVVSPEDVLEYAKLPDGPTLPRLSVTGLAVTKADLMEVLRFYVPQVVDFDSLGNERFLLSFTPLSPHEQSKQ